MYKRKIIDLSQDNKEFKKRLDNDNNTLQIRKENSKLQAELKGLKKKFK